MLSTYKLQLVEKSPITTHFVKTTYIGLNVNPIANKDHTDVKNDEVRDKAVITATPLVPNLKPKKPEQILLNKGKNIIKLTI